MARAAAAEAGAWRLFVGAGFPALCSDAWVPLTRGTRAALGQPRQAEEPCNQVLPCLGSGDFDSYLETRSSRVAVQTGACRSLQEPVDPLTGVWFAS